VIATGGHARGRLWPGPVVGLAALVAICLAAALAAPAAAQSAAPDTVPDATPPPAPQATGGALAERETFLLGPDRRPLALAHGGVVPGSLRLVVGGEPWQAGRDFRLRARSGLVVPLRDWSDGGTAVAVAEYAFTIGFEQPRVGMRPMAPPPVRRTAGEAGGASGPLATEETWSLEPAGELDVRGSKAVYVSSGTRRELTVDQNLRLNVSGQLTREIYVRAQLTDDNLPVVPEGNTEELQDIDKVLVELTAPRWAATLGDFVAYRDGTLFGGYRRKLQGFSLAARPGAGRADALFGSPRGRYRTVEIRGEESNQGPYFLGTGEAGRNLFVVAGSERVSIDGEVLARGADRDYVIDYVRGTVTFTFRRLITAESLIVVEFEEGEGAYGRTVVGGGAGLGFRLGDAPGAAFVRITRESDAADRLRTGELSAADEAVLAAAGDDPLAAVAEGAVEVAAGLGDYQRLISGDDVIYEFVEEAGTWQVQFFYAGPGLGDYEFTRLTETGVRVYTHVGEGMGTYRVGRLLPLPESQNLVTAFVDLGDTSGARLHGEWHLSSRDANVLSDRDDGDNDGQAVHVRGRSGRVGLAGGELEAAAAFERRDDRFAPFLRHKTVYDYEGWGLGARARREGFLDERDQELHADVAWRTGEAGRRLQIGAAVGRLEHGADLQADRLAGSGSWEWEGGRGRHAWRRAVSEDGADPLDILRRDQQHELGWLVGPLRPHAGYRREMWRDDADTTAAGRGWRLEELSGGLGSAPGRPWSWDLTFTRGLADSLRGAGWERERDARTWQGTLTSPRLLGLRAVADATLREVRRPGGQDETTRLGRLELGASWPGLGSEWSLGYSVDNSRTEVLAREVVFVGTNQGRYDEAGNFVGEGRGDYELVLAGTDSLVATTSVRADLSWRQDFAGLGAERLWGAWTSQTRIGVEARSLTDDIAGLLLLRPAVIFDEEDAVLGRVDLSEEVALLKHLRALDLRWRFDFSEAKDRQYAQGREDRLRRDHTVTVTWSPTAVLTLSARGGHAFDRRETDDELNPTQRGYQTLIRRVEVEGAWRPRTGTRLALAAEVLDRDDAFSGVGQRELALRPTLRWRVAEAWSAQAEVRVADVRSDEPAGARRPFFFPTAGTNVESSARVSWDPSQYLGFALAWFGRKPGGREWQHDLRLESTARF